MGIRDHFAEIRVVSRDFGSICKERKAEITVYTTQVAKTNGGITPPYFAAPVRTSGQEHLAYHLGP